MRLDYTKVKVLQDAFTSLLNNQFLSDIKFTFPDGRIIFAHSFVLCCRSDEFCDSFEATIGVSKLIQVQNVSYEEYLEFLKYLYTDACNIDDSNATSVIQLTKKHELLGLETKCIDVMLANMSVENACKNLELSIELELENLRIQLTKFIAENYTATLNAESFVKIHDEALKAILELDAVTDNDELQVFNATMKWAEEACVRDGLKASDCSKRQKLGDNLKLLRFGAMTSEEFTACIKLAPALLTKDEQISIFMNLSSGAKNSFGFANVKRQLIPRNSDNVVLYNHYDYNICNKWLINSRSLSSSNFNITFSVSHSITIEKIGWHEIYVRNILMAQFLENSTTIYEGRDIIGFLNGKNILQANTLYKLNLIYYTNVYNFCTQTSLLKFLSKGGQFEFIIYAGSAAIIENVTFKY